MTSPFTGVIGGNDGGVGSAREAGVSDEPSVDEAFERAWTTGVSAMITALRGRKKRITYGS